MNTLQTKLWWVWAPLVFTLQIRQSLPAPWTAELCSSIRFTVQTLLRAVRFEAVLLACSGSCAPFHRTLSFR